ncbi:unnamed protein product, partial [Ceratitis capitata]
AKVEGCSRTRCNNPSVTKPIRPNSETVQSKVDKSEKVKNNESNKNNYNDCWPCSEVQ